MDEPGLSTMPTTENGSLFSTTQLENFTDSTNSTSPLKLATTVVMTCTLTIVMLGVGCCIELPELWAHIRRPYGILIGGASQFVVLPLATFALAHALQLPPLQAIGMLIMSCCPGGSTSNMFTMWVDGDVPLSLAMTTVNTVLSAGVLPLNLLIYSRSWTSSTAVIPYLSLVQGFAMMFIPAAVGIGIRRWKPTLAAKLTKLGSVAGSVSILAAMVMVSFLYPFMYRSSWRIYLAVVALPFVSFAFGYITAVLFRMSHARCRTVALETGIQNFPFCMTLLTLSFSREEMGQLSLYPLLFGVFILVDSLVVVGVYKTGEVMYTKWTSKTKYTSAPTKCTEVMELPEKA